MENKRNSHLSYNDRLKIEKYLDDKYTFTEIAKEIGKDRTTIAKEIQKHVIIKKRNTYNNTANLCINRKKCRKFDCTDKMNCYQIEKCSNLIRAPYVCNGCIRKNGCRQEKRYYSAIKANKEYKEKLSESRLGINADPIELYEIDKLITPLIKDKKQSIAHVYANHPDEIKYSRSTMYNYINLGLLTIKNIDLPRKVRYKKRKNNSEKRIRRETYIRKNRTYVEFSKYISQYPNASIVEMDTVEGIKGGKVLLTLLFRKTNCMLIYLIEKKTMDCVTEIFSKIKVDLGSDIYKKLFKVVLTDNGSEFFNPDGIEKYKDDKICNVFYCDPAASWQKGAIEKNHEFIRYILPKKTSFNDLTQNIVTKITNHINSISRDSLGQKTPYQLAKEEISEEVLKKFDLKEIKADEVNLSPKMIREIEN